ncbi:MAG: nucleotidyltransferase domain-containing protein [Candidatus Methanofastidiosia archaeon]
MKEKTVAFHRKEVIYTKSHWKRLYSLRLEALEVMEAISAYNPIAYGSIARGDIHKGSDVDIFIPDIVSSYLLEINLENFGIVDKIIAMATPWHLIKAHLVLSNGVTVTFSLVNFKNFEKEFYYFGGAVTIDDITHKKRVAGVDKRLILTEPTENGHRETEITGREAEVAKLVGVSLGVVRERQQVLNRRNKVGRTGIYLQKHLAPDDNIELELKRIADKDSNVKKRYRA